MKKGEGLFRTAKLSRSASIFFELGKWFIITVLFLFLIHYFVVTIFVVSGDSMEPNFHDKEVVLINRFNLFTNNFKRGDSMVLKFPGDPEHTKYIKRLAGLPGETVEIKDNGVYINDKRLTESYIPSSVLTQATGDKTKWVLGEDQYFLIGDNRQNSSDSRIWGVAERKNLTGPVKLVLFPRFEFIATPPY